MFETPMKKLHKNITGYERICKGITSVAVTGTSGILRQKSPELAQIIFSR
jgi:hypothetical protein